MIEQPSFEIEKFKAFVARLRMHPDNKTKAAMQVDCESAADIIEKLYNALMES